MERMTLAEYLKRVREIQRKAEADIEALVDAYEATALPKED